VTCSACSSICEKQSAGQREAVSFDRKRSARSVRSGSSRNESGCVVRMTHSVQVGAALTERIEHLLRAHVQVERVDREVAAHGVVPMDRSGS
jgi:hypothetical protein